MEKKIIQFIVTFFHNVLWIPSTEDKKSKMSKVYLALTKRGYPDKESQEKEKESKKEERSVRSGMCIFPFNEFFKIQKWNVKDAVNNLFVYFLFENVLRFHKRLSFCPQGRRGVGFPACITCHMTRMFCIQEGWADHPGCRPPDADPSRCRPPIPGIRGILRETVNKPAVRILLECILVIVVVCKISHYN